MSPISIEIGWKVDGVMPHLCSKDRGGKMPSFWKNREDTFLFSRKDVKIAMVSDQ